jgi:hypothetical protein
VVVSRVTVSMRRWRRTEPARRPVPAEQNEIAGRVVDAMMAKDVHGMNDAAQELADLNTAHQGLAEDIAKYKANTRIDSADAAPAAPEPAKPRRARKATKQPQQPQRSPQ